MSLSIIKRPQGYINRTTANTGTYTNGSSVITNASHGLSTGDIVYVTNNQATGFWYVTILDANTFNISEYSGAVVYQFIGSGTFTYYKNIKTHGWNAVHLPIIYKLSSTIWPTNSVDTARTVSSYANDNGYVKLTLSGAIKSDVTELEFVKVTYVGGTTAVYQILSWYSTSIVTINLPYVLGITFSTVQYYYQNYHARIRVYAGLQSSHIYASQKPFELITEQKAIPDSNGVITFNVAEFIKQKIDILKNDLLKGTLQNNLDAFCQFYITYAEAYDYSTGGYTLLDYVGAYTDDSSTFIGYAVNADLPFKNTYSGAMSQYVPSDNAMKFLTPSLFPELTSNQFFDISFLNNVGNGLRMKREAYSNGSIISLFIDSVDNKGKGIYRFPVSQSIYLEDRIDLTLQQVSPTLQPISNWTNSGSGTSWITGGTPTVTLNTGFANSKYIIAPFAALTGVEYKFTITVTTNRDDDIYYIRAGFLNASFVETDIIYSDVIGFSNVTVITVPTIDASYVYVRCGNTDLLVSTIFTLTRFDYTAPPLNMSETKTITVIPSCSKFTNYNICWLNYLGGFDWKVFQSSSDLGMNIEGTKTVNKNIYKDWPRSFGEGADTIKQETSRNTRQTITLRAENQTSDQINDLFRLKESPLVQIVNSSNDRRTIIPDAQSFVYYKQREKLFNFEFTAIFTDNLPSQAL